MLPDLTGTAIDLTLEYGLVAVFVILILDAAMLLPGLPGEFFMILAVHQYAKDHAGLALVVLVATVAATIGSALLYGIARGASARTAPPGQRKLFAVSARRKEKLTRTFRKPSGQAAVFFARLFPVTRLLVSLPAGVARMPFLRFLILTLLGNLVFHAAFMWLAFESRRPGSAVAARADLIQEGYANPAWAYVEANWILVAAAGLVLALLLSIRAAVQTRRNPDEGYQRSWIGLAARLVLLWGGVAILVGLWVEEAFVYEGLALSGYDVRDGSWGVPGEPTSAVAGVAAFAILLAWALGAYARSARRSVRRVRRDAEQQARAAKAAEAKSTPGGSGSSPSRVPPPARKD